MIPRTRPDVGARSAKALIALVIGLGAVSCGGATEPSAPEGLSPSAQAGWDLTQNKGCVACHGRDGGGGSGPSWIGLAGSTRTLDDGTEVVADRDYLVRAVADPQADQVNGYNILMPQVPLTPTEVASIVDFLEEFS